MASLAMQCTFFFVLLGNVDDWLYDANDLRYSVSRKLPVKYRAEPPTQPNLHNQTYIAKPSQTHYTDKPTHPNLPSLTYTAKPSQTNLHSQTYTTKPIKTNYIAKPT